MQNDASVNFYFQLFTMNITLIIVGLLMYYLTGNTDNVLLGWALLIVGFVCVFAGVLMSVKTS